MTYQEIQNRIVDTFWSDALKVELKRRNYVFPPEKLLSLAYKQAKNDTQAMEMMKLFAHEVPGTLYWLGARKPGTPFYPLHSDHFSPDEAAMKTGMEVMISSALAYLANPLNH